jgi:fatty-acyl-CoA synthase
MNGFTAALMRHFAERADAPFCRQIGKDHDVRITWGELARACGGMQARYADAGIASGDQVLIFLRHTPALYPAFFGAMLSGIVPAFMPCASPRQDPAIYWSSHQELLDRIAPAAIVTDRAVHAEMIAAGLSLGTAALILVEDVGEADPVPSATTDDAIALLQHSSGTTGLKKGVALSARAIIAQCDSYGRSLALTRDDVIVSWLPLYHDMGLIACMILPAYFGLPTVHIDPLLWVGKPRLLFDSIAEERGTLCWLPNFAFEHLAATTKQRAADFDLSSVRAFINCSEPCKPRTFDRFLSALAPAGAHAGQLHCCYAMAETVFAVTQTTLAEPPMRLTVDPKTLDRGMRVTRSDADGALELIETGRPIAGICVAIVDEQRQPLPEGYVGEIALSGDFLFTGYNADATRTAQALADGHYYSRDIGVMIDGRLYVLGRTDDLIIINGRNLYAHEIEAALSGIDGLKPGRAVAIAKFHPPVGSQVLIVLAERRADPVADEADLRRAVIDRLQSTFEVVPFAVRFLPEGGLIKTTSGKISRDKNRERYLEDAT